ncbi:MAG: diguanylate cyclase [Nocardioidaceae bacterium]
MGTYDAAEIDRLLRLIRKVQSAQTLDDTLRAIVDGVVEGVGFEIAALNVRRSDGWFDVAAVAGNDPDLLAFNFPRVPPGWFERQSVVGEAWGNVVFVPHEKALPDLAVLGWIPDMYAGETEDAWHPMNVLFVLLRDTTGDVIGALSVDVPRDRRLPGQRQLRLLESFGAQASAALEQAILTDRLAANERVFRSAFDGAVNGMLLLTLSPDTEPVVSQVNEAVERLLGRSVADMIGRPFADLLDPSAAADDIRAALADPAEASERTEVDVTMPTTRGESVWVDLKVSLVEGASGKRTLAVVSLSDISARKREHQWLYDQRIRDPLTGAYNTRMLEELGRDRAGPSVSYAAVFCDLDRFKAVNDAHGHAVGDSVLVEVARRLRRSVDGGGLVVRTGGDEFVVLVETDDTSRLAQVAERIRSAIERPITVVGVQVNVSVSVGTAMASPGTDLIELVRRADHAMYADKHDRRGES